MRLLIAAACVAVIAFVGYFFWGEYIDAQARERTAEANALRDFKDGCDRIIINDPKYDAAYAASLSRKELATKQDECIFFDKSGKLP